MPSWVCGAEAVCGAVCREGGVLRAGQTLRLCRRSVHALAGVEAGGSSVPASVLSWRRILLRTERSLQLCCRSCNTIIGNLILSCVKEAVVDAVVYRLSMAACCEDVWSLVRASVGGVQAGDKLVMHVKRCE